MTPLERESSRPQASGLQVEQGTRSAHHFRAIWLLVPLVSIAAVSATLLAWSPRPSRTPIATISASPTPDFQGTSSMVQPLTWSPNSIDVLLSLGNTFRDVTFASSQTLKNVVIVPVPEIAPFVTIVPNTFPQIRANVPQTVRMTFTLPPEAILGIYQGTVHLRVGMQTLPQTLKVTVNLSQLDTSYDVQKAELANDIRSGNLNSAYLKVGTQLANERVFDGLDMATLTAFADALAHCAETETTALYRICASSIITPAWTERANFTFVKDGFGVWRLLSW